LLVEIQKKHEELTKKEESLAKANEKLSSFFAVHLQKGISLGNIHAFRTMVENFRLGLMCRILICLWSVCLCISKGCDQPPVIALTAVFVN